MTHPRLLAALLLCLSAPASAAPAPWHLWRSKYDGKEVCTQASPGPGWEHSRGPFRDARCTRPMAGERSPRVSDPPLLDPGQASSRSTGKSPANR